MFLLKNVFENEDEEEHEGGLAAWIIFAMIPRVDKESPISQCRF